MSSRKVSRIRKYYLRDEADEERLSLDDRWAFSSFFSSATLPLADLKKENSMLWQGNIIISCLICIDVLWLVK